MNDKTLFILEIIAFIGAAAWIVFYLVLNYGEFAK